MKCRQGGPLDDRDDLRAAVLGRRRAARPAGAAAGRRRAPPAARADAGRAGRLPPWRRGGAMTLRRRDLHVRRRRGARLRRPVRGVLDAARLAARQQPDRRRRACRRRADRRRARTVQARGGLSIVCGASLANHPPLDVLIVPGGVVDAELARADVVAWIAQTAPRHAHHRVGLHGRVPAGEGGPARWPPCHDPLGRRRRAPPPVPAGDRRGRPRLDRRGPDRHLGRYSAGIDMSLHLVSRLAGEPLARATARQMDYHWARWVTRAA